MEIKAFQKKAIDEIIHLCLVAPGGDPTGDQYDAAAWAYSLARSLNIEINDRANVKKMLEEDTGNNYLWAAETTRTMP